MSREKQPDRATLLQVRILSGDLERLRRDAGRNNATLAEYVRAKLGVLDPPRGGAREGAGRAKKQPAKRQARRLAE